jgi:hypothetical protein
MSAASPRYASSAVGFVSWLLIQDLALVDQAFNVVFISCSCPGVPAQAQGSAAGVSVVLRLTKGAFQLSQSPLWKVRPNPSLESRTTTGAAPARLSLSMIRLAGAAPVASAQLKR